MATAANALVIMTKAPVAGQVKTRLVPPLSYEEAARVAAALLHDQLANLTKFTGAALFINYAPPSALAYFAGFSAMGFAAFPQEGADLGARMRHAFDYLFQAGYEQVALIGSDLPTVPHATIEAAFQAVTGRAQVVFAPSLDGGYYLVAMSRPIFDIFENIVWSRNDVLASSIEILTASGIRHELLRASYDIDDLNDLRRLLLDCENGLWTMPNTAALLKQLRLQGIL